MSVRTARASTGLALALGVLSPPLSAEALAAPDAPLAQLDARERALRQEFTRQRYERERRQRDQEWRDYRDRLREQQQSQDARRRESVLGGDCAGQAARVRESLDSALDSARAGAGTGTDSAEDRLGSMGRAGCDPLELHRLEQELRQTRKELRNAGD